MNSLHISIHEKFTQKDLEPYIRKYWEKSFNSDLIEFDLSNIEWINSEEITFLFSWIVKLKSDKKRKVKITFTEFNFLPDEKNIKIYNRRKFYKFYVLAVWGLLDNTDLKDTDFINISNDYNNSVFEKQDFNFDKVIPFQRIPVKFSNSKVKEENTNYAKCFNLEPKIVDFLNANSCYSPFENKIISHIITKELVINSMEHTSEKESYFTTALVTKWKHGQGANFIKQFKEEKESITLDFFRDKEIIKTKVQEEVLGFSESQKTQVGNLYFPEISNYDIFKNQSYLEFTYIDYGEGIFTTLKDEYSQAITKNQFNEKVSKRFFTKHIHSQILEYAMLMESSKEPFVDEDIRYNDLIPRGLYFIVDMVRRYKGLLVARSGYGKVVYDFSNRIRLKKNVKSIQTELERIYVARDAIVPNKEDPIFFPGTMFYIILPQRLSKKFKKSSVRIDNELLNRIVFNRDDPNHYPAQIYSPESYEFLNLAFEYQKGEEISSIKEFNSKTGIGHTQNSGQ